MVEGLLFQRGIPADRLSLCFRTQRCSRKAAGSYIQMEQHAMGRYVPVPKGDVHKKKEVVQDFERQPQV